MSEYERNITGLKKTALKNFTVDYTKMKKTKIGCKVQKVRIQRSLFKRKLSISK